MADEWADDVRAALPQAEVGESFGDLVANVPATSWATAVQTCRDELRCDYFDWLSAVDEGNDTFHLVAHLYDIERRHRLLVTCEVTATPDGEASVDSVTGVFPGAAWHERETHEMFGIEFRGHPNLSRLLLSEAFQGHPLRKDFVLAARAVKPWPGLKDPSDSRHASPSRRKTLPPGVPDPAEWGPDAGSGTAASAGDDE